MRNLSDTLLFIAGSPALTIILKTTFVLALGLMSVWATNSARAAVRHLLLACTFAALLALPIASFFVPSFRLELEGVAQTNPAQPTVMAPLNVSAESNRASTLRGSTLNSTSSFKPSLKTIIYFVWGLGAGLLLLRLVISLFRLRTTRRSAIPSLELTAKLRELAGEVGIRRTIEVLVHDDVEAPFTYGLLRPAILLPNDAATWSELNSRRVLIHELEHIKRGDWITQLMARAVCAFYWFQPLVWIAWRQICLEAERSCDDAVVMRTEHTDYAEQLVGLARRLSNTLPPPVLSMANRSDLSRRISSILDSKQARGRAGLHWTVSVLACSSVVIFAVAPGLAITQTQKPTKPAQIVSLRQTTDAKTAALNEALLKACDSGKLNDIEQLLSAGAEVNGVVDGDGTALIVAAREGNTEAVSLLLKHGADVNLGAHGDGNPLIMAAREGHENIVTLLLDRGADVNQVVDGDENALIQASASGELGVVKLLASRGADLNARVWAGNLDGEYRTALSMARRRGHLDVVEFLLSQGARE